MKILDTFCVATAIILGASLSQAAINLNYKATLKPVAKAASTLIKPFEFFSNSQKSFLSRITLYNQIAGEYKCLSCNAFIQPNELVRICAKSKLPNSQPLVNEKPDCIQHLKCFLGHGSVSFYTDNVLIDCQKCKYAETVALDKATIEKHKVLKQVFDLSPEEMTKAANMTAKNVVEQKSPTQKIYLLSLLMCFLADSKEMFKLLSECEVPVNYLSQALLLLDERAVERELFEQVLHTFFGMLSGYPSSLDTMNDFLAVDEMVRRLQKYATTNNGTVTFIINWLRFVTDLKYTRSKCNEAFEDECFKTFSSWGYFETINFTKRLLWRNVFYVDRIIRSNQFSDNDRQAFSNVQVKGKSISIEDANDAEFYVAAYCLGKSLDFQEIDIKSPDYDASKEMYEYFFANLAAQRSVTKLTLFLRSKVEGVINTLSKPGFQKLKELSLSEFKIDSQSASKLAASLPVSLEAFSLLRIALKSAQSAIILQKLVTVTKLKQMEFQFAEIDSLDATKYMNELLLKNSKTLESVVLNVAGFDTTTFTPLCDQIRNLSNIRSFGVFSIKNEGQRLMLHKLLETLKKLPFIKSVTIADCDMQNNVASEVLKSLPNVEYFSLMFNKIDINLFQNSKCFNANLKTLDLSFNNDLVIHEVAPFSKTPSTSAIKVVYTRNEKIGMDTTQKLRTLTTYFNR